MDSERLTEHNDQMAKLATLMTDALLGLKPNNFASLLLQFPPAQDAGETPSGLKVWLANSGKPPKQPKPVDMEDDGSQDNIPDPTVSEQIARGFP